MAHEFASPLLTPWGVFRIEAGTQGVTRIRFEVPVQAGETPVPYDLAHAWNAYETGLSDSVHLPIDLTASPAVQRFYLALRRIPRGEEKPLADLAREAELPLPEAREALAACPLPLAIPLHRVPEWTGLPGEVRCAIIAFEREHPRLPKPEIPWKK